MYCTKSDWITSPVSSISTIQPVIMEGSSTVQSILMQCLLVLDRTVAWVPLRLVFPFFFVQANHQDVMNENHLLQPPVAKPFKHWTGHPFQTRVASKRSIRRDLLTAIEVSQTDGNLGLDIVCDGLYAKEAPDIVFLRMLDQAYFAWNLVHIPIHNLA